MSLNLALALLPNTSPAAIGCTGAASLSFAEATGASAQAAAVAAIGPHTIVVDPTMQLPDGVFEPPYGTLIVDLAGTADVYVGRAWIASPRLRVLATRELAENQGDPLPYESLLDEIEDPEDAHLEFFCRTAGLTVEQLMELRWAPLAVRPSSAPTPEPTPASAQPTQTEMMVQASIPVFLSKLHSEHPPRWVTVHENRLESVVGLESDEYMNNADIHAVWSVDHFVRVFPFVAGFLDAARPGQTALFADQSGSFTLEDD